MEDIKIFQGQFLFTNRAKYSPWLYGILIHTVYLCGGTSMEVDGTESLKD